MKLILSSFAEHLEVNIDANDDQADDNTDDQADDNTDDQADDNTDDQADDNTDDQADDNTDDQADDDTDINEILWIIQLNVENRVRPQLPHVIGQPEHFEINNEINNFGDLIQWIINNRVTIQVSKYATGG